MDPPFKTASEQSDLFAVLCGQWDPIWNSQLIWTYKEIPVQWQIYRYIETNAHIDTKVRLTPPVLTHEVTNTEFEMKYPDSLLLTSSGQEWQFDIATDS